MLKATTCVLNKKDTSMNHKKPSPYCGLHILIKYYGLIETEPSRNKLCFLLLTL